MEGSTSFVATLTSFIITLPIKIEREDGLDESLLDHVVENGCHAVHGYAAI